MYFFSYSLAVWTRKAGLTLDTGDVSPATTLLELRWATWADNLAHNFSHNQQFKKSSLKAVGVWAVFISAHAGAFSYCSSPNQTVCVVWSLGNSALSSPPPDHASALLGWDEATPGINPSQPVLSLPQTTDVWEKIHPKLPLLQVCHSSATSSFLWVNWGMQETPVH